MPRLNDTSQTINAGQGFKFSGVRPEKLGATEYTLAQITLDYTGSTRSFAAELRRMQETVVEGLKKSPRANNLLLRICIFSDSFTPNGVLELVGFSLLKDIDLASIVLPDPSGLTPLYDATLDGALATNAYARRLFDQDFAVNAIQVVVTDGGDNASPSPQTKLKKIREAYGAGVAEEYLESNLTILVRLNATGCKSYLDEFSTKVGFGHDIDVADASPGMIAKLGGFISRSVSSQSQALGTGGPSQSIAAVI